MLTDKIVSKIKSLFIKTFEHDNYEFEIMFNNYHLNNKLSFVNFIDVLNFIKYRSQEKSMKLINEITLDISYNYNDNNVYRISIKGLDKINNILNSVYQRKNHIIFSLLCNNYNNDKDIIFINKKKEFKNILDIDEYNIRVRLSTEEPIDNKTLLLLGSNIQHIDANKIFFRFKNRISLIIFDNDKLGTLRLDLTFIKSSNMPDKLQDNYTEYEIELEYVPNKSIKPSEYDKILNIINHEIYIIKQILENSNIIITQEESNNILKAYKKLLFNSDNEPITNLYTMNETSTEIQYLIEKIPNKYSVTDKADGKKYQLFIFNNTIYLISYNLVVKKTKYTIENLNNSLFEGEFIHITNKNVYLFMCFDCLYYNGENIRNKILLKDRIEYIYSFLNELKITHYKVKSFIDKYDIDKQELHYKDEINKFYDTLNEIINKHKNNDIIFYTKYFIFPTGAHSCEVYLFSYIILNGCLTGKFKSPYYLDGIIYTGIEQKYTKDKKEQKHIIYKYKPPNDNSIDVYLIFQKNLETNELLEVYDNSINGYNNNTLFRIANFYVGDSISNKEVPVLFMKEANNHEAFLLLEDGEVKDLQGKIVLSNTVVEIIYTNDLSIPHQYRWKILRTRWDKTESVLRDKKRYGNFKDHAIRIWKSIRESVTIDEIKKLSHPDTYYQQQQLLISNIDNKIISTEKSQDKYFQKITTLGQVIRNFHNWIKSIIYYSYFSSDNNQRKSLLDIGCGRGSDLMKMYHVRLKEYIGIDNDYEALFNPIDSAKTRYTTYLKKYPDFIKSVNFILMNSKAPYDSKIQESIIPNMTIDNKKLIDKFFTKNKKFDIINFGFSLHYFFDSTDSINNILNIIDTYLNNDGYVTCTLIDPLQLMKLLNGNENYTSMYTDEEGKRQKFFEIIKKFNGELQNISGQAIDVYMGWISNEGTYLTEYLVVPQYLINLMEQINCELVDTDLFVNLYNINKEWFTKVIETEENEKNKQVYKKFGQIYGDLKGADKGSIIWNELFRFYVFKKIDS
uniref:mRNA cap 0 methyltransferase domain-containing protein n=1 Tax=viral metagenome TaxID=1070528 RepID=A0A6C0H7I9_9ZZZZ